MPSISDGYFGIQQQCRAAGSAVNTSILAGTVNGSGVPATPLTNAMQSGTPITGGGEE